MTNISKLNFYDPDAVKAFVLDILVENKQLDQSLTFERTSSNGWFKDYQAQKERAEKAETQVAELKELADSLAAERDTALAQRGGDTE